MTSVNDIETQAMDWLVRLDALETQDAARAEDDATKIQAEFMAWCEADPRRHAAYLRLRSAWRKADQLRHLSARDGTVDIDLLAPASSASSAGASHNLENRIRSRRFSRRYISLAAAALICIGAATWLTVGFWRGESHTTGVGGFERLLLADGSTVELDTDSQLRVRMTNRRRHIVLLRGRANFKVAADARRPFEVQVAETTVRALGTAFSVRLRDRQQVELLVTEGRVAVVEASADGKIASEEAAPVLSAGEAAVIKPRQPSVSSLQVKRTDIARQLSWTQGRLTFDGETLGQAVSEFNRYNPRALVIADPGIAGIKIGGSFQPTDPQSFITALERSFGVKVQSADAGQIRLTRAEE